MQVLLSHKLAPFHGFQFVPGKYGDYRELELEKSSNTMNVDFTI